VHVWRAELTEIDDRHALWLLDEDERERSERILDPARGRLWCRSRALLRELTGRYLAGDPRAVTFTLGAHGKPAIAGAATELRFSVSHSDTVALYAFALGRDVGVDVQTRAPAGNLLGIARRAFEGDEAARLAGMAPVAQRSEFLALWARHEARVKCHGGGLGDQGASHRRELSTMVLPFGPGTRAAVAVEGASLPPRCWRWAPVAGRLGP
jgi:4'-phosphopantetheinyl transferase